MEVSFFCFKLAMALAREWLRWADWLVGWLVGWWVGGWVGGWVGKWVGRWVGENRSCPRPPRVAVTPWSRFRV